MTQNIEQIVADVNQGIGEAAKLVEDGNVPEFKLLDERIVQFSESLRGLPPEQAKEYASLLETWGNEIRKISDKLNILKDDVAGQISGASTSTGAAGAYGAASNLIKP